MEIYSKEFYDGIAFYLDGTEIEIAFYSRITDKVRYNQNWDKNEYDVFCANIPMEMNCKIIDEIIEFKRSKE